MIQSIHLKMIPPDVVFKTRERLDETTGESIGGKTYNITILFDVVCVKSDGSEVPAGIPPKGFRFVLDLNGRITNYIKDGAYDPEHPWDNWLKVNGSTNTVIPEGLEGCIASPSEDQPFIDFVQQYFDANWDSIRKQSPRSTSNITPKAADDPKGQIPDSAATALTGVTGA